MLFNSSLADCLLLDSFIHGNATYDNAFGKDFCFIDLQNKYNQLHTRQYYSTDDLPSWNNVPPSMSRGVVMGMREVYYIDNSHVFVVVTEFYPVLYKRYVAFYNNGNWTPWFTIKENTQNIMFTSISNISIGTSISSININYSCPKQPIMVIPIIHGGVPAMCSVNTFTDTSAQVLIQGATSASNRRIQLLIVY